MSVEFNDIILEKNLNRKIRFSVFFVTLIFLFIFSRLVYLQILKGGKYNQLSTNNRIRVTKLPAPRGIIYSKDRQILVDNKPSFDLNLIPQDTADIQKVLTDISELLSIDRDLLDTRVKKKRGRPPFEPITLKKELTWKEMSLVLSRKMDLQGITIDVVPKRLYCFGSFAPHVFGFLGEINKKELRRQKERKYDIGDLVGKYGLEKLGEKYLHGQKGGLQTEVDVYGNRQKVLAEISPVSGDNVVISIVPEVQKKAEELLKDKTGTIVAMDPVSGEILALANAPQFDSNLFARGIDVENWQELIENPYHPLLNRAIQSQQPPGSVFKIVTIIAALEEKLIDPGFKVFCPGHYKLGIRNFDCWKRGGHGWVDMRQSLVESCDVYFYTIALKLGVETIYKYAERLGFGVQTGIELEDEKSGLLPSPKWKKKRYGTEWQRGETLNISIGQGFLLATPIQIALVYSGVVNRGILPKPRIVLEVEGERHGRKMYPFEKIREYSISRETCDFITDALVGVVSDPKGTGSLARIRGVSVAGKTGTAQVASKKTQSENEEDTPWHLRDHAWFAAYAPAEKPEIVVCVLIEHGGSGGSVAAPIAREVLKSYLSLKEK